MGNVLQDYARMFYEERLRSRKLLSLFLCLSIFVSSGVLWQLKMIAVSADDLSLGVSYIQRGDYSNTVVVHANWSDNGLSHVGDYITFDLMADVNGDGNKVKVNNSGSQYEQLSSANNWTMTFDHMPDLSYEVIVRNNYVSNLQSGMTYDSRVSSITTTPTPSESGWQLVTDANFTDGEYLIVYNNRIVVPRHYNGVWGDSTWGPHPYASNIAFDASNGELSSYAHRYSSSDNTFIYNTYNADGVLQDLYLSGMSWGTTDGQFVYNTSAIGAPVISAPDSSGNRTLTYGHVVLDVNDAYYSAAPLSDNTTPVQFYKYSSSVDSNAGKTFTYTLTNVLRPDYSGYGSNMNVPVNYYKTIDRLDDNNSIDSPGFNPDTQVCGADFYRLYLDVRPGTNPPIGTDLVIVVDQSWSMNSAISSSDSMTRSEALKQILNGSSGLVQSFLADNSLNNVAVVGFDGMRFRYRNTMPTSQQQFDGDAAYKNDYLDYYAITNSSNVSYDDPKVVAYNDTLENEWGYNYTQDAQVLLGWTNSSSVNSGNSNSLNIEADPTFWSGTNYEAALMLAYDMFNSDAVRNNKNNKILIFISDGVPTCFISNNGTRRDGTTLEGSDNVEFCSGPSIQAFDTFLSRLNGIPGFKPSTFSSYAIGIFDQNLNSNTSVLSNYVVGDGRLLFCDDVDTLKTDLEDIMLQNPYEVTISDTLSSYVEYYGIRPDLKLTMTSPGGITVDLFVNDTITPDGAGKIQSVIYDENTRTVTAIFDPNYYLEYGYTYTLSYNVRSNEYAYNAFVNGGYNQSGSTKSDYANNQSSSEQAGFYSNESAWLQYRFENRPSPIVENYTHPVIQIDADSYETGNVTIEKLWVDEHGNSITPAGDVRLELHQVGTFEDGVSVITIDNVYRVDGQEYDYVTIEASDHMQYLYSSLPTAGFQNYVKDGHTERLHFEYTYYVVETSTFDGFTSICEVATKPQAIPVASNPTVNLTNQYSPVPVPPPSGPDTPSDPSDLPENKVVLNKTIDDLGDGAFNPDTDVRGTDLYRIYLEATSTYTNTFVDNSRGVDLVLVLDQSWSMAGNSDAVVGRDANGDPIFDTRQVALDRVVNGYNGEEGLISLFLNSNPANKIAVVGFDGMRFRYRNTMPTSQQQFNGNTAYKDYYLDYYAITDSSDVSYDDPKVVEYNNTLENEWGYDYSQDTQELLSWTNSAGFDSNRDSVRTNATFWSGTNYSAALLRARDMFASPGIMNDGNDKVLVFISDGVPTCFISNNGARRDGTTLEGSENVEYCSGPSIQAFNDFMASLNQIPGFNSERFSSYAIGIFDQNLHDNTDVLSSYVTGNGRLMFCDDVTTLRTNLSNAMGVQTEVKYPNNVVISDTLSQYVDFYTNDLDVVVAMTSPDGVKTVLYENDGITTAGSGVVRSVQYSLEDKTIECRFEPNYALLEGYVYALSFNTKVTQTAYDDFESNSYNYGAVRGETNTDYEGNSSSSERPGFYSNADASVSYKDERGPHKEDFPHPVIQVDTGEIVVHKYWSDGTSIIPPNQVPIQSSVNVQLYRVGTLVQQSVPAPGGRWVLVEDDSLTDGEYLIVANNQIVDPNFYGTYTRVWTDSRTGPHPHTNSVTFNATNASLRSYVHKYTVANGFTYNVQDSDGAYKDLRLMCHYWSDTNPEFVYASQLIDTSPSGNYYRVDYSNADSNGYRTLESINNNSAHAGLDVTSGDHGATTDVSNSTRVQFYRYEVVPVISPEDVLIEEWGTEVTISAINNWTYTYEMLPKSGFISVEGVPVKYTFTYYVVETSPGPFNATVDVVDGQSGTYNGNATLVDGVVNITNTIDPNINFTLPNAGGVGIYQFLMIGSAIVSVGLFYDLFIRKKRERRQLSR